jgi:PAS domain S-box-containing protein
LVDTFIYPKIQESVRDILQNALQHGKGTSNYELEFKTKSNEIRHLLVNITPQHDMNNVVVGVVLIAQDVTEAVERDRAVASIALELRQLIETANAPIFGIDVHGKVNEWNTRMSTITGFAKEEAINIPLVESFIAPSMKEKVGEILDAALNGNETSNYEVEVPSKSGEPIFLLVNATTRRDADSNVVGVVGVAQDVTEDRKHAKEIRQLETLRASQEAKVETERNMTAYFAHELRNPLGAIDSALAAMPDKLPDNALSLVNGMQLCTKFMSSIMNNLLDVRKMEEGKMRLGIAPISIRDILQNVHKMLEPSIRPGVEFRKLINVKGNDWVLGDAHRIEQVLTNVISNAIKYTVTGHIQISIECEKDNVKFICEDTGPGIPKSEQAKLFQRFVQRGGCPGTGLGLAIAKHIVDLTGGSIRFESDPSVRAGTTCIVLMALPPCKAPGSSAIVKKAEFIKEPLSVLVIDDIKMNRTMVKRRILKGIAPNAKIKEAATGEEALLICAQDKFDVMIVDQFMEAAGGVMVGTDVVFAMRRMRIDSVLIGCSGNDIGTQFLDAGADMVWQKPMPSNEQIIRDLRTALDKRGIALSAQNC